MSKGIKFPSVRFTLKSEKGPDKLILAVFRYHGNKLVYSSRLKINERQWDKRRQSPRNVYPLYDEYKTDLDNIEKAINRYYQSITESKRLTLTNTEFKDNLDTLLGREEIEKNDFSTFSGFVRDYLSRRASRPDANKNTIKRYKNTLNHIEGYEKKKKVVLLFEDINWSFKEHFCNYLYSPPFKQSQNTVHKHIKIIKMFMREAKKEGLHNNSTYEHRDYTVGTLKVKKVALTRKNIQELEKLDLSYSERLNRVRDLFLLSCYTGLRYSDFINIKKENKVSVEGYEFLNVITKKTGMEVLIPYSNEIENILKKYDYNRPKPISNQRMNDYIKEICALANIDDPILYQYSEGGKRKQKYMKKYELCSNHTGRRTWATLMYMDGYPIGLLRAVLGHSSDAIFLEYVGAKKKDYAIQLAKEMAKKKGLKK